MNSFEAKQELDSLKESIIHIENLLERKSWRAKKIGFYKKDLRQFLSFLKSHYLECLESSFKETWIQKQIILYDLLKIEDVNLDLQTKYTLAVSITRETQKELGIWKNFAKRINERYSEHIQAMRTKPIGKLKDLVEKLREGLREAWDNNDKLHEQVTKLCLAIESFRQNTYGNEKIPARIIKDPSDLDELLSLN